MAVMDFFAWVAYLKVEAQKREQEINKMKQMR